MTECIFCKIVGKEIPCAEIFSTENLFSFLDIAPTSPGHALIVPKKHYHTLWDLPKEISQELVLTMQKVGQAIMQVTEAEGMNVLMNNYRAAGQIVDHAHWHLIPRMSGDGMEFLEPKKYDSEEEMHKMAERIKNAIKA